MPTSLPTFFKQFGDTHFIRVDGSGVHVDLAALESSTQFCDFIDRVVAAGFYFKQLDYPAFLDLVSRYSPEMLATRAEVSMGKVGLCRFAASVAPFEPSRQALYRVPFVADDSAEYLFEPVMMDKTVSVPLYDTLEDGSQEVVGSEERTVQVRTKLDFDEFVVAMWAKGIRYGLKEDVVRAAMTDSRFARIAIAQALPVTPGTDADLLEIGSKLHRDDAPLKLPNGAIDLRHFGNRFPQVKAGERLMQKIPCVQGKPGFSLMARPTTPPAPEDFDLAPLAGEGTTIAKSDAGEFLVARIDGFLNIDTASSRISVTEKIINYSGVSLRTTGDIALQGDHFEEHGEVQEKRVVKGKNITVMADVFGEVISQGGVIHLKQNLVGGAATNDDGDIIIDGLTSNATLVAKKGRIVLSRVENSVIIGQSVEIDSAVNSCVLADSVAIRTALGCQIAGKQIHLEQADARRHTPTTVSIMLPDLVMLKVRINEMRLRTSEITGEIDALRAQYDALVADTEVRNYLAIAGKVQRKELTLNATQKSSLLAIKQRIAPSLTAAAATNQQIQALIAEQKDLIQRATGIREQGARAMATVSCLIDQPSDDIHIRKLYAQAAVLFELPPRDLRQMLSEQGQPEERLPVSGEPFSWRPQ